MIPECKKTINSSNITHNNQLLSNILNKLGESDVLYANNSGVLATAEGNSVILNKSVTNYRFVLIVHKNGVSILTTEQNKNNIGNGLTVYWYNNGLNGTFYNNTIYAVIGLVKKE